MTFVLGAAQNYSQMLSKVAVVTGIVTLVLVDVVRDRAGWVDDGLAHADFFGEIDALPDQLPEVAGGNLVAIVAVVVLSRVFKLHDRLSDLLRIRARFDKNFILVPLFQAAKGSSPTKHQITAINTNRRRLMRTVFYQYASSDPKVRVIDAHYVERALDIWTWYWVFLEATFLVFISAVLLIATPGNAKAAMILFVLFAIGCLVLYMLRRAAVRCARDEVDAIVSDPERKRTVSEDFNSL